MSDYVSPRIYAACLASYNAGRLFGVWIDCEGKDGEAIRIKIDDMLARSPEPNVMRRKCPDCGHYQTDARPYRENDDECGNCGEPLSGEFKPSAEEWAIHDHEGFCGLIKSEWPDLDELEELAEALADDDDDKRRGLLWLVNDRGYSVKDALVKCDEVRTSDESPQDYAYSLASDCIENFDDKSSQWPFTCIDWESAAKELLIGGDIDETTQDGEIFLVVNAHEF